MGESSGESPRRAPRGVAPGVDGAPLDSTIDYPHPAITRIRLEQEPVLRFPENSFDQAVNSFPL